MIRCAQQCQADALQAPLLFGLAYVDGWAVIAPGAVFMFVVFGQVTVNDAMVANFVAALVFPRTPSEAAAGQAA